MDGDTSQSAVKTAFLPAAWPSCLDHYEKSDPHLAVSFPCLVLQPVPSQASLLALGPASLGQGPPQNLS